MTFEVFRRNHYAGDLEQVENGTWEFHPVEGDLRILRYVSFQDALAREQIDSYRGFSHGITRHVERSNAFNGSNHVGIIHTSPGLYWLERFGSRPIIKTYTSKHDLLQGENVKEERN